MTILVGTLAEKGLAQMLPYQDQGLSVEERVNDLLARMTLEERIDMLGGYEAFCIRGNERLGIPVIKMSDGPLGVRNSGKATAFPAGIAFAATWHTDLMREYGEAVGREARSKGVHIMLSPGVNIHRVPMCGRNFEYFGEDPYLASRMAVAYILGVQSQGVAATVKHFAANNQEYARYTVSSDVNERTLREIYLPTFRAAVEEAQVGAVMTAYNLLNGVYCSENAHLLRTILKKEWGFDGFVMSDWGATDDAVAATNAGLDLEMPSGERMNRRNLLPAIKQGRVSLATIDDKIRRMLRIMFRFGWFDRPQTIESTPPHHPDSRAVALQAAREATVLLKNDRNLLPIDRNNISSIAVLGPNAHPAVTGGGGSSRVDPFRSVSFLDGVINLAGNSIRVYYSPGVVTDFTEIFRGSEFWTLDEKKGLVRGLKGEYFANKVLSGVPILTRIDRSIFFRWGEGSPANEAPADSFSVRWTGSLKVKAEGEYEFIVRGDDGYRLYVNDQLLIDNSRARPPRTRRGVLRLASDTLNDIKLEYVERRGNAEVAFGWSRRRSARESEAVGLAAKADVALVCVGFNPETEGEDFDRPFELPDEQVELLREVANVNKNTIVVITAGGNVAMSGWIENVAGLLQVWYPGQEGGTALAEILFGEVNPSGKLPVSFEERWEDNACYNSYLDHDGDKRVAYSEGILLGYRHFDARGIEPMFPFGFGLSYTTFEYGNLSLSADRLRIGQKLKVSFDITNTGIIEGADTPQLYVHDIESSEPRPLKELKGFAKVRLKPGETRKIEFEIDDRALSYFSLSRNAWFAEPGEFEIGIGSSSPDIRLRQRFTLLP